ncbi:MAG: TauD/TfdA dioxygenase family protein [Rhodospirillales bacterium]|jgi:taurine dioxygenase
MSFKIIQNTGSGAPLGTVIEGVDLENLDDEMFAKIEDAFNKNYVIVFHDQNLSPDAQVDLTTRLGKPNVHVRAKDFGMPGYPSINLVTNVQEDGKSIGSAYAGVYWHSDLCFQLRPSRATTLFAIEVPEPNPDGTTLGDTQFANTVRAYETLPAHLKKAVEGRRGIFQYARRQSMKHQEDNKVTGRTDLSDEQKKLAPDVTHPIVRSHPLTGEKCLFINETYTFGVTGMPEDEGRALVLELQAHITKPDNVYRHQWRPGDLIIWDNTSAQHKASKDYSWPEHRRLLRHSGALYSEETYCGEIYEQDTAQLAG